MWNCSFKIGYLAVITTWSRYIDDQGRHRFKSKKEHKRFGKNVKISSSYDCKDDLERHIKFLFEKFDQMNTLEKEYEVKDVQKMVNNKYRNLLLPKEERYIKVLLKNLEYSDLEYHQTNTIQCTEYIVYKDKDGYFFTCPKCKLRKIAKKCDSCNLLLCSDNCDKGFKRCTNCTNSNLTNLNSDKIKEYNKATQLLQKQMLLS